MPPPPPPPPTQRPHQPPQHQKHAWFARHNFLLGHFLLGAFGAALVCVGVLSMGLHRAQFGAHIEPTHTRVAKQKAKRRQRGLRGAREAGGHEAGGDEAAGGEAGWDEAGVDEALPWALPCSEASVEASVRARPAPPIAPTGSAEASATEKLGDAAQEATQEAPSTQLEEQQQEEQSSFVGFVGYLTQRYLTSFSPVLRMQRHTGYGRAGRYEAA